MTPSNLRERVARAIEESLYGTDRIGRTDILQYGFEADAAIAIVLEEAAKVAEERVAYSTGQAVIRDSIATAIRELKEKP